MAKRKAVRWLVCTDENRTKLIQIGVYYDGSGVHGIVIEKRAEQPVLDGIPTVSEALTELELDSRHSTDVQ